MKAVRLVEVHRPLQMQEIPVPTIGDDDVLVRVRAAGICHTDVHYRATGGQAGNICQGGRPRLRALRLELRQLLLLQCRQRTILRAGLYGGALCRWRLCRIRRRAGT